MAQNRLHYSSQQLADYLFTDNLVDSIHATTGQVVNKENLKKAFKLKYQDSRHVMDAVMVSINQEANMQIGRGEMLKKQEAIRRMFATHYSAFMREKESEATAKFRKQQEDARLEKEALERQKQDRAQGTHTPQQGLLDQIDHVLGINLESLVFKALFSVLMTPGFVAIFFIKNVFEEDPETAMDLLKILGHTAADVGDNLSQMIDGVQKGIQAQGQQGDLDAMAVNAAAAPAPRPIKPQ